MLTRLEMLLRCRSFIPCPTKEPKETMQTSLVSAGQCFPKCRMADAKSSAVNTMKAYAMKLSWKCIRKDHISIMSNMSVPNLLEIGRSMDLQKRLCECRRKIPCSGLQQD